MRYGTERASLSPLLGFVLGSGSRCPTATTAQRTAFHALTKRVGTLPRRSTSTKRVFDDERGPPSHSPRSRRPPATPPFPQVQRQPWARSKRMLGYSLHLFQPARTSCSISSPRPRAAFVLHAKTPSRRTSPHCDSAPGPPVFLQRAYRVYGRLMRAFLPVWSGERPCSPSDPEPYVYAGGGDDEQSRLTSPAYAKVNGRSNFGHNRTI